MPSFTPSCLGFALAMLILPWVEIRCDGGPGRGSIPVVEQTGIQTMTGKHSLHPLFRAAVEQREKTPVAKVGGEEIDPLRALNPKKKGDAAVFVIAWAALAALGLVIGLAMAPGGWRSFLLGGCSVAAVACLVVQGFVVKFPAVHDADRLLPTGQQAPKINNQGAPLLNPQGPPVRAVLQLGFWLALAASLAACVGVVMEAQAARRSRSPWDADDDLAGGYGGARYRS